MRNRLVLGLLLTVGLGVVVAPLILRRWAIARSADLAADLTGASPAQACVAGDGENTRALFAEFLTPDESSFDGLQTALQALPGARFLCRDSPWEVNWDPPEWFVDSRRGSPAVWCAINHYTGDGFLVRGAGGVSWLLLTETADHGSWPSRELAPLMGFWCR